MLIVDLSDQIFRNLSEPADVSIPSIAAWLRFDVNLGKLNELLGKDYSIDPISKEIIDTNGLNIGTDESGIYETMYSLNYYDRQIRRYLGAGSLDVNILQEATSDQGTLRFVSRNEIAKSFMQLRKDCISQLNQLINSYKFAAARPSQVTGDDLNVEKTASRVGANTIVSQFRGGIPNNTMP